MSPHVILLTTNQTMGGIELSIVCVDKVQQMISVTSTTIITKSEASPPPPSVYALTLVALKVH